jgi:Cu(I)/Ag(I) efflux system membrane fusion protein
MLLTGMISGKKPSTIQKKGAITIPNSAILWTGDRSVVYVSIPDNDVPTYQYREVEIGNRSSKTSTIISGLDPGEEIVMNGAFAIDAAAQLNNNMSMMNRNVKVKQEEQSEVIPSFADETPDEFVAQLDKGVLSYLELKNALVQTDKDAASLSADMLLKSISEIDMKLIKGEAHIYWMEQLNSLKSHGESIKNSNEIEKQRDQFDFLSQAMINTLKAFGTADKTYYIQYCPMAKDNQGADWISTESQIRNPYFGDKMMKCGSVKLELN